MNFNEELLRYTSDKALAARIDEYWEKVRKSGDPFLHELPQRVLVNLFKLFEEWKAQYTDYEKLSIDTTRRLSYALGLLQDMVSHKRPFSRSAIRGWIHTLSVPLQWRTTDEVKREFDEAPDIDGDDWLRHAREYYDEFKVHVIDPSLRGPTPLADMPSHVAIGRIEQGMQSLGTLANMVLLFMEKIDGERKEVGQALQDFNKDMERLTPGAKSLATEDVQSQRVEVWNNEVIPRLRSLLQSDQSMGVTTLEELKALSACLGVAIKARDNNRR